TTHPRARPRRRRSTSSSPRTSASPSPARSSSPRPSTSRTDHVARERPGAAASRPGPGRTPEVPVRETRNPPADPARPAPDDLQKITGIGAALAARLTDAGVTTYRELASHTPQRLAALTRVPTAKIVSQDWAGQARRLAGSALTEPEGQQKYATFHVELLIDADNAVRRTKTRHFQTDTEDSWPGWDDQRIIAVIRRKAGLAAPAEPRPPERPGPPPSPGPPPIPP